jgi:4-hydroxy-tetrahydrodipicolinate synthase
VQTPLPFTGTYTAIVTPFRRGGKLDETALESLVRAQVKGGVNGIVPVGTTGESPTLDYEEHIEVIKRSIEFAGGKLKVLAGTGGNSTSEAIYLTKMAKKAGADGSLQVAPYYNKPTQEGLFQHFRAIASATDLPLVLYSIPGRCGIEIAIDTVKRLPNQSQPNQHHKISEIRTKPREKFGAACYPPTRKGKAGKTGANTGGPLKVP